MRTFLVAAACVAAGGAVLPQAARAHAVVGDRFFPTTVITDDPGVSDELSLPVFASSRTGDDPSARQLDVTGEWQKTLTRNLGISFAGGWSRVGTPGGGADQGFQNLETTLKYVGFTGPRHEAILAGGLGVEWGGTGARRVGAEPQTTVTSQVYAGKGFGDLRDGMGWARPFAVTAVAGYAMPTRRRDGNQTNPDVLHWGLALEYSLPYLAAQVKDLGLPDVLNRMTPVVEASFERPVAHAGQAGARTTGTINPGLIWSGGGLQLAAEASVPINRASGHGVGVVIQVHWFIDDLFPHSLGRPIW